MRGQFVSFSRQLLIPSYIYSYRAHHDQQRRVSLEKVWKGGLLQTTAYQAYHKLSAELSAELSARETGSERGREGGRGSKVFLEIRLFNNGVNDHF